jgi:preprotein translocase subunit YajC
MISKIENEQEVQVEIAENVRVRVAKATITQVFSKTEPLTTEMTSQSKSAPVTKSNKPTKSPAKKSPGSRKKTG